MTMGIAEMGAYTALTLVSSEGLCGMAAGKYQAFIELGRRVIHEATPDRYGRDAIHVPPAPPACRFPQPGFVGRSFSGIVILNPHPGEGARSGREATHRRWDMVLERWLKEGGGESYESALRLWEADRAEWGPVWTRWLAPLLAEAGLSVDQVAFLNLIKNQLRSGTSEAIQGRIAEVDWEFTAAQLTLLKPTAVLAAGKFVGRMLDHLASEPLFDVRVQNRARARRGINGPELAVLERQERAALATWLREAASHEKG